MRKIVLILLSLVGFTCCKETQTNKMAINKDFFGKTKDGIAVDRYSLSNSAGMRVQIITYGGIITTMEVPDRNGIFQDVVLGYDKLSDYEESSPYFGALIGRFGNRIAEGKFRLEGKEYTLAQNDGENHLHGGTKGFDKVVWRAFEQIQKDEVSLKLIYLSKDMEEGYPGNLSVEVLYTLTQDNTLKINYKAVTDQTTILNLTQHSYFNLSGTNSILDHELMLNADAYLPVDETLIPTGEIVNVAKTPFDFTKPKKIGREINDEDLQLKRGLGYDHCWVLNEPNIGLRLAAVLSDPKSGRQMEVFTDQPGIQFYSGNFLDGTNPKKNSDEYYPYRSGLCLETQHYPNAPNEASFPTVVLNPQEVFTSQTQFKFSNPKLDQK